MNLARMLGTCLLLPTLLLASAGCQRQQALQAVGGKVSYKGALLNNGVVIFTPDATRGESGQIALGTIREDGTYVLATGEMPGATPGWYRVTVTSNANPPPRGVAPGAFQTPTPLLPEKYLDPELSHLRCEIKPNHANTIDLNLD